MVKIIPPTGFCYGVKNCIQKVKKAKEKYPDKAFYFLRPLVHNGQTNLEIMKEVGALSYDPDKDYKYYADSFIVTPAHGYTKAEKLLIHYLRANLLECTCPFLNAAKGQMKKDIIDGYQVYFLGKSGHAETLSVLSDIPEITFIDILSAPSFSFSSLDVRQKVAFYPQSTFSYEVYEAFKKRAKDSFKGQMKFASICHECLLRWENAKNEVSFRSAVYVVVGDPSSSNAVEFLNHLTASFPRQKCVLAPSSDELKKLLRPNDFKKDFYVVSATSTSDKEVKEVYSYLVSSTSSFLTRALKIKK